MTLFISVVNHNHDDMICENSTLKNLATEHQVILKSNTPASSKLNNYCKESNIHLIQGKEKKGFGANNNEVFAFAESSLDMQKGDHFLVLNPDVEIELSTINQLIDQVISDNTDIAAINLYRDREMTIFDNSIRRFPSLLNPVKTLLNIKRTDHYDKEKITQPTVVDWAAGSFLLFSSETYLNLQGFDEKYFMYFEDVDICKRAKKANLSVNYYPHTKATHLAQYNNRKLLSKHSWMYMSSMMKFLFNFHYCVFNIK